MRLCELNITFGAWTSGDLNLGSVLGLISFSACNDQEQMTNSIFKLTYPKKAI